MAYFSNGTEGAMFHERWCSRCLNAEEDGFCCIWDAHTIFNYDQLKEGNEQLQEALEMLIPKDGACYMFRQKQEECTHAFGEEIETDDGHMMCPKCGQKWPV